MCSGTNFSTVKVSTALFMNFEKSIFSPRPDFRFRDPPPNPPRPRLDDPPLYPPERAPGRDDENRLGPCDGREPAYPVEAECGRLVCEVAECDLCATDEPA